MSFTVIVKKEAHQDTIDAYNYYEEKLTGLGKDFLLLCSNGIRSYLPIQLSTVI